MRVVRRTFSLIPPLILNILYKGVYLWLLASLALCFISRLATKVTIAGGALYIACDSGLLGNGVQGSEALEKTKAAIPPAFEEWTKYFGLEVPKSNTGEIAWLELVFTWKENVFTFCLQ